MAPCTGNKLAYVTHSGMGHQLQMLLRGLFLAHLTGRKLLLPPMMTHRGNLVINGEKGCMGTAQKWEYRVKDSLLLRSNKNLAEKCATEADSFASVFDLTRFAVCEHGCGHGHVAPCAVVHYSATKLHSKTGMACDYPPPCDELIARVAQRADEVTPVPEPARGQYYHGIRQVADHLKPKPKPEPKPKPKPEPKPKPHQERLELQLAQCRERLVSRTEQLLTLETMEEEGEHADAQAAVSAAAAQIAQELRRVT